MVDKARAENGEKGEGTGQRPAEAEAVGPIGSTGGQGCDARTMQVLEFGGVEGWAQEVQRLRVELSVCMKERDEAVQSVAVAQHAHQSLGIELSSWLASFEKVCGEMKDKEAEASARAKELKSYQAQLKQVTVDRDEAIKSLGEANTLLEQSKQSILEDKMENEKYIKELLDVVMLDVDTFRDALSAELNTYHQNNLRKENCIKALTDLNSQQQKIEIATSKRTEELHDLHEHKNALVKFMGELTAANDVLAKQNESLAKQNESLSNNILKKDQSLAELRDRVDNLEKERDLMVRHNYDSVMSLSRLEESKQKNIEDNMQKEQYIEDILFELETSRGKAKELTAELDAVREHNISLSTHKNELVKALEEAQGLHRELFILHQELERAKSEKEAEVSLAIAAMAKDNMQKEKYINEMTAELDALREYNISLSTHKNELVKSLGEARTLRTQNLEEKVKKEMYIKELTAELDAVREHKNELVKALEEAQGLHRECFILHQESERAKSEKEAEVSLAMAKVSSMAKELSSCQVQLNSCQKDLANWQAVAHRHIQEHDNAIKEAKAPLLVRQDVVLKDKECEKNSKSMANLQVEDPDIKEYEEFRARQRLLTRLSALPDERFTQEGSGNKHASPRVSFDDSPKVSFSSTGRPMG